MKKLTLATLFALGTIGSAAAAPVTVSHVTWDPDLPGIDFAVESTMLQEVDVVAGTTMVTGYGRVTAINGENNFMDAGWQLTFVYTGFKELLFDPNEKIGDNAYKSQVRMTGGQVQFFADNTTSAAGPVQTVAPGNFGDGILWLSLNAQVQDNVGSTAVYDWSTNNAGLPTGTHMAGFLDVSHGAAAGFIVRDFFTMDNGDVADINFDFGLTNQNPDAVGPLSFDAGTGTGSFFGDTITQVPEPGSLALAGLGLFGLGALRRRQEKK